MPASAELSAAIQCIRARCRLDNHACKDTGRVGLVLGSGLGYLGDEFVQAGADVLSYEQIPGMPVSAVAGHAGRLICVPDQRLLILQGRVHFYEGYSVSELVFPTQVLHGLGVHTLLLTNAAGAVNESFAPGDFMLIEDALKFLPVPGSGRSGSPLQIAAPQPVFSPRAILVAQAIADELQMPLHAGVYAAMSGPNYETPAEVRMLRKLGADAVGMSTVLEAAAAAALGMSVAGISCITNSAAGIAGPLSHAEVQETAEQEKYRLGRLLLSLAARLQTGS